MKFNTELIIKILGDQVVCSRIKRPEEYAWIDIINVDGSSDLFGTKLIFASYGEENEWHFAFDRRGKTGMYSQSNHVVVDFETDLENTLQVKSLEVSAKRLYDYTYSLYSGHLNVIGVTGSVGKTTTVGMFEFLLKKYNKNVVRFYSKRIFPLSLFTHYINKVDFSTEYIVMEYSLFFSNHVEILAQLLPPKYAFILNVLTMHLEERLGLNSKQEIFFAKSKIFVLGKTEKIFLHDSLTKYASFQNSKVYHYFNSSEYYFIRSMPPTLRTFQMLGAVKKFQEDVLQDDSICFEALRDYVPVEQRIILVQIEGKEFYFHGETSTAERLVSFLENREGVCNLFVDEINFSQGDPNCYREQLKDIFERDNTFVLDTGINRSRLHGFVQNVKFLSHLEFFQKFTLTSGYVVYHKALFVRQKEMSIQDYFDQILNYKTSS
jgi:hypothetical protein